MNTNGFNNNFQQTGYPNNFQSAMVNTFGSPQNNVSVGSYTNQIQPSPVLNSTNISPSPITIGFVRGKMGVSSFPIMSSNTTVYLFDVQDQTKFYIKATDAFGMAMPIREFEYHEVPQQQTVPDLFPVNTMVPEATSNNEPIKSNSVSKEEFEELKKQINVLLQRSQNEVQSNKQRKEKTNNV